MRGLSLLVMFGLFPAVFSTCRKCPPQHLEQGCPDIPHFDWDRNKSCFWDLERMSPRDHTRMNKRCDKAIIYRTKNAFNEDVLRFHCNNTNAMTLWVSVGFKFGEDRLKDYASNDIDNANDRGYVTELCLKCANGTWHADFFKPNGQPVGRPPLNSEVLGAQCFYVDWRDGMNVKMSSAPDQKYKAPPTTGMPE